MIPAGQCQCGCGQLTNIARQSDPRRGLIKGEPAKFLPGHWAKAHKHVNYCSVDGCDLPVKGRSFCRIHYSRWRQNGDPGPAFDPADPRGATRTQPEEILWRRVERGGADECWEWTGRLNPGGYGQFNYQHAKGEPRTALAHRISYAIAKGPIPDGLTVDHLCSNRVCVNPAHLEAVTQAENNRRGLERRNGRRSKLGGVA